MCVRMEEFPYLAALDRELVIIVEDAAGCEVGHVEAFLHGHISEVEDPQHVSTDALNLDKR